VSGFLRNGSGKSGTLGRIANDSRAREQSASKSRRGAVESEESEWLAWRFNHRACVILATSAIGAAPTLVCAEVNKYPREVNKEEKKGTTTRAQYRDYTIAMCDCRMRDVTTCPSLPISLLLSFFYFFFFFFFFTLHRCAFITGRAGEFIKRAAAFNPEMLRSIIAVYIARKNTHHLPPS